ncbi:MAG: chromosome segregation protein SMC [Pseudomonadota bacterium]
MKFTNLRLVGFKSFVDTTDFDIREGLTGIVGPNGCGKSNLLEALRWVMGATSAKALRGGGMADVIFAGTSMRPARNWAEVTLTLDNSDRSAPAEYNENETIEVSRRIVKQEDGTQSIYRINAKEVRAKDVQLLFADASTGANSPALVRQGQISELINAKPQNRRRLLEEAAGITGLHTRRHEAELRLRAAEQNLERLEDVTGELETQKTALQRQARQATRYRNLSGDIRRTEAAVSYLRWKEATDAKTEADSNLAEVGEAIETTARAAVAAATAQQSAHDAITPLREEETRAAAALHRLTVAKEGLDEEAARAKAELERLVAELERLDGDIERETVLHTDAANAIEALAHEETGLKARENAEASRLEIAEREMTERQEQVADLERTFEAESARVAETEARRKSVQQAIGDTENRIARLAREIENLGEEKTRLALTDEQRAEFVRAQTAFAAAREAVETAEATLQRAEERRTEAELTERAKRTPRDTSAEALSELKAECDALQRVVSTQSDGEWSSVFDAVSVVPGYENALAAALGDDLDASDDAQAPTHWSAPDADLVLLDLPIGAAPLSRFVRAPNALTARLSMIGIVDRMSGPRLARLLKPGQRLVSAEGDLWRWDGYVSKAEAKSAAAVRLEQRNRLAALQEDLTTVRDRAEAARAAYEAAQQSLVDAQASEKTARQHNREARDLSETAQRALTVLERSHERANDRIAAIETTLERCDSDLVPLKEQLETLREELTGFEASVDLQEALTRVRESVNQARVEATEARAAHTDLAREADMRTRRLNEIARERGVWTTRSETAQNRVTDLKSRRETSEASRKAASNAPAAIEEKRLALLDQVANAETTRNEAADALATATTHAQQTDHAAKAADAASSEARELRARFEAQAESAIARVEEATALAMETCNANPEALLEIAEIKDEANLPAKEDVERKLERYKRERENLGGVNLRADEELTEIAERLEEITVEREDCEAAIRKLRSAIGSLNREARERLNAAFETVNNNFQSLFTRLFNGGQAELRLIDSDDVLEAGLEIFASPPGKKLASMSLMSGGEQALTATALIFAVFMANPAPVCVLDEVDAPLDDANTDRFCRLLNEMVQQTETRFIIITHHALSMSRMDRLFGVTMIERGVSQLVSVDLNRAEQLAAAE